MTVDTCSYGLVFAVDGGCAGSGGAVQEFDGWAFAPSADPHSGNSIGPVKNASSFTDTVS
jgi:hypothetical protein